MHGVQPEDGKAPGRGQRKFSILAEMGDVFGIGKRRHDLARLVPKGAAAGMVKVKM